MTTVYMMYCSYLAFKRTHHTMFGAKINENLSCTTNAIRSEKQTKYIKYYAICSRLLIWLQIIHH